MSNIAIISGSTSESSRLNGVTEFVGEQLRRAGHNVEWVHVRLLPPEDLIYTRFDSPAIAEANRVVQEADGVAVATPIYKAAYAGALKTFLDLIPQKGLERKAVLPLAIGGTSSHLLAIDYALKPVLSALGARTIVSGVYVVDSQVERTEGGFSLAEDVRERLEKAAGELVQAIRPVSL